jgi:16S rRNA (uracil1498-N3)-methyltransferase
MKDEPAHRFLFFSGEAEASSESIDIAGADHHHMTRVLRMRAGAVVYLTNGRGLMLRCRIEEPGRRATRLGVLGVEEHIETVRQVTLALAMLRKDAFERAIEQCTELGVTTCVPFLSERCHIKRYSDAFVDRLRRVAVSAAKQSFRSLFPGVESPIEFDVLVGRVRGARAAIVGDAEASPLQAPSPGESLMVIVGPEGGLTEGERASLTGVGGRLVSVSRHRLRSETAAVALLSVALAGEAGGKTRGNRRV